MKKIILSFLFTLFISLGVCAKDIIPTQPTLENVRTVGLYQVKDTLQSTLE